MSCIITGLARHPHEAFNADSIDSELRDMLFQVLPRVTPKMNIADVQSCISGLMHMGLGSNVAEADVIEGMNERMSFLRQFPNKSKHQR